MNFREEMNGLVAETQAIVRKHGVAKAPVVIARDIADGVRICLGYAIPLVGPYGLRRALQLIGVL